MIQQQLLLLHTRLLCTVLDIYEDDGTAKVHPLTMLQTTAGEVRQHIVLKHIPMTDNCQPLSCVSLNYIIRYYAGCFYTL